MADDDWDPDLDFPGLDSSAVITDVGVDQFVLCHQVRAAACFRLLRKIKPAPALAVVLRAPIICTNVPDHFGIALFKLRVRKCIPHITCLLRHAYTQAKVEPMLHITIALHKGLNGPLTGTGAMEAPGAGATMTLEVDFQTPGQEGTHHMSMPIGGWTILELDPNAFQTFRGTGYFFTSVRVPRYARFLFRTHFDIFSCTHVPVFSSCHMSKQYVT